MREHESSTKRGRYVRPERKDNASFRPDKKRTRKLHAGKDESKRKVFKSEKAVSGEAQWLKKL